MSLFTETARTLALDVQRTSVSGSAESVLAASAAKEIRLGAGDEEKSVTLFFHTAQSFQKGDSPSPRHPRHRDHRTFPSRRNQADGRERHVVRIL